MSAICEDAKTSLTDIFSLLTGLKTDRKSARVTHEKIEKYSDFLPIFVAESSIH